MTHRGQFDEVGEDLDLDSVLENEPEYARESADEDDNEDDYNDHQSEGGSSESEQDNTRDWRGKIRQNTFNSRSRSPEQEESEQQNGDLENIPSDKPIMLYVGSLHFSKVTTNTLQDLFSPYGQISRINLVRDSAKGRSRGFAFVVFENPEDGKRALKELDGSTLAGRSIKVSVAKAAPKDLDDSQEDDDNSKKRPRDLRERLNQRNNKRPRIGDISRPPLLSSTLAGRLGGMVGGLQTNSLQGLLDSPGQLDARNKLSRPGGGLLPHNVGMTGGLHGIPLKDPNKVVWEWQEGAIPSGATHMSSLSSATAGLMRNRMGGVGGDSGRVQLEEYQRHEYEEYERRRLEQLGRQQLGVMGRGDERDMLRAHGRYQSRYDDPRQTQAAVLGADDERALSSIKARAALAGSILRSLLPSSGESSQNPSSSPMMDDPPLRMPQTQQSPWAYPQSRRSGPLLEDPVIRSRLPEPQYPRAFSPPRLVQSVAADSHGMQIPLREQERHRSYSSGFQSAPVLNDPVLQQMARARAREQPHPYSVPSGISSRW